MMARLVGWILRGLVPFQSGDERAALVTIADELGHL
jgi:hypothetical protein